MNNNYFYDTCKKLQRVMEEREDIAADFIEYNKEIDRIIAERNVSEGEAIKIVDSYWNFPM